MSQDLHSVILKGGSPHTYPAADTSVTNTTHSAYLSQFICTLFVSLCPYTPHSDLPNV